MQKSVLSLELPIKIIERAAIRCCVEHGLAIQARPASAASDNAGIGIGISMGLIQPQRPAIELQQQLLHRLGPSHHNPLATAVSATAASAIATAAESLLRSDTTVQLRWLHEVADLPRRPAVMDAGSSDELSEGHCCRRRPLSTAQPQPQPQPKHGQQTKTLVGADRSVAASAIGERPLGLPLILAAVIGRPRGTDSFHKKNRWSDAESKDS